jgi:hypothetical protein
MLFVYSRGPSRFKAYSGPGKPAADLGFGRHIADLIEKNRPMIGGLESSRTADPQTGLLLGHSTAK